MKRLSGPQGRVPFFLYKHFWRGVLCAGLFAPLLALLLLAIPTFAAPAFAAQLVPAANAFSVSPTSGPVGAVITVSGSGVFFSDGTQIKLGYTLNNRTCNLVAGQLGIVNNGAFRGWFRWPASTGTGTFGVCASANTFTFQVGNYQVLSASAPRIVVAPTTPRAGRQATVSGAHFLPGGTGVSLIWRSVNGGQSISLGAASSSASGAFTYAFTVPARASTGSYILTALVGNGTPATLSATTTFHVEGITIAAVPTPTVYPSPTAVPTTAPTAPVTVPSHTASVPAQGGEQANQTGLFVSIALGGAVLIVLALGVGILLVRRQRAAMPADPTSGPLLWPEAATMFSPGIDTGAGAYTPWPGVMYPGSNSPSGNPGMEYSPLPGPPPPSSPARPRAITVPFDPGLVEAMREAQVSLFATPRPPANEEIEVQ